MKKCIILVIACLMASITFAQEQIQTMDDAARIALSAYMDPSSSIPNNAKKTLKDRMQKIITKNGMGSAKNTRFIMTANVRELNYSVFLYLFVQILVCWFHEFPRCGYVYIWKILCHCSEAHQPHHIKVPAWCGFIDDTQTMILPFNHME